jgi:hypothetical protein
MHRHTDIRTYDETHRHTLMRAHMDTLIQRALPPHTHTNIRIHTQSRVRTHIHTYEQDSTHQCQHSAVSVPCHSARHGHSMLLSEPCHSCTPHKSNTCHHIHPATSCHPTAPTSASPGWHSHTHQWVTAWCYAQGMHMQQCHGDGAHQHSKQASRCQHACQLVCHTLPPPLCSQCRPLGPTKDGMQWTGMDD